MLLQMSVVAVVEFGADAVATAASSSPSRRFPPFSLLLLLFASAVVTVVIADSLVAAVALAVDIIVVFSELRFGVAIVIGGGCGGGMNS